MFEPEVCYHLNQLGINPLKTAFPWIFYAFVGYLDIDQVSPYFYINSNIDLLALGQNSRI